MIFSGTVAENLRLGMPEATDDELQEACMTANAHEFISALPDGIETRLGDGGVK